MQNAIGYNGFGAFIELNFDRFLMPGAIFAALCASAFIGSL